MALDVRRPWQPLTEEVVRRVPGQLGVYELGDDAGTVTYVGMAGGRSLFGLRGELDRHRRQGTAIRFRYEVNMQYQTRYRELLMLHRSRDGQVPPMNRDERLPRLGRLSVQ